MAGIQQEARVKDFIITYDIEPSPGEPERSFLEAASQHGWSATLDVAGQSERLPANTLIGTFRNIDRASCAFDEAVESASQMVAPARILITRRFLVQRVRTGRLQAIRRRWVQTNIARLNKLLRRTS